LKNMQSRADQIGANLKIASSSGKGTKITLSIPI
jgi:signal transduction histidine kinase